MIKGKNKYIEEKANFKNLCKISFVKFLKNCIKTTGKNCHDSLLISVMLS